MTPFKVTLGIALSVYTIALPALADGTSPHGYIEPCAVSFVEDSATSCESCSPSASGDASCSELAQRGYERKCRTAGHAAAGEVWCISKHAALARAGSPYGLLLIASAGLALLGALFWWKRRRQRAH